MASYQRLTAADASQAGPSGGGLPLHQPPEAAATSVQLHLQVTPDGIVYVTNTGSNDPLTWRIYRISSEGEATVLVQGAPLNRPNE